MSASSSALTGSGATRFDVRRSPATRTGVHLPADRRRALQTALGLLWLVDGALQFQSFMYSRGFIHALTGTAAGQPDWLASSVKWAAGLAQHNLVVFNTQFALTQVLIGLGLLYRRTVKPALVASLVWSLVVWWFGEGLGMLLANNANPLTGAPGAVLLYAIIALLAWPSARPAGMLSVRAAKGTWMVLWLGMAWLWLLGANSSADATSDALNRAPSGVGWLTSVQHAAAHAAKGNGLVIAVTLALLSGAIGVGVASDRRPKELLAAAIALSGAYWVIGQGLGGIFTGSGTDPNAGPLFILLALALYPLTEERTVTQWVWSERIGRIASALAPRRASPSGVAVAGVFCFAAPPMLWGVLQTPFARADAFGSTATLDAAHAMPSAHKWLVAVTVVQLAWAAVCALRIVRGRPALNLVFGTALATTAALVIGTGILVAHLLAPNDAGMYGMMPVGLSNQRGDVVALLTLLLLGTTQLAAGAYVVLSAKPEAVSHLRSAARSVAAASPGSTG